MNQTNTEKKNDCQKIIAGERQLIIEDLKKAGIDTITFISDLDLGHSGENQIKAIPILLANVEKRNHVSVKETIYRDIACASDWLKGELLTETVDTLFEQFENDDMLFTPCHTEDALEFNLKFKDYEGVKSMAEVNLINTRWVIGLALNALVDHKLASHKKYQDRIRTILKSKKYRKGRSQLVLAYARLGKEEAIPDLIELLDSWDLDVLGNTIVALGKLKAKEAKPSLEKLLKNEDPYFRDLARKALKKIG